MFICLKQVNLEQIFRQISQYSVASTDDAAFIIGGYDTGTDANSVYDTVAKFQDNQWSKYGSLNQSRKLQGSITFDGETMILGGRTFS